MSWCVSRAVITPAIRWWWATRPISLSLLPSGLVRGKLGIIGNGVVVDPEALLAEIDKVAAQGLLVTPATLRIAENAALILPFHGALDRAREAARGEPQDRHHRPRHRPGV